jgi:hypothetical protein
LQKQLILRSSLVLVLLVLLQLLILRFACLTLLMKLLRQLQLL